MRKITLLLSFIACVLVAQAQLIVSDNFDYTVNTELKSHGWIGTGATPSTINPIMVVAPSITYSGYPGSVIGNQISLTTTGEDLNKSFPAAITTGTIYFSALVNLSAAQATGDYFFHIGDLPAGTSYFARVFAKLDGTNIAFGIQNISGGTPTPTPTYSTSTYSLNTTYLLVVKFEIASNTASLIINPVLNAEPSAGWLVNNSGTGAVPAGGFTTINVRQGTATNAPTLVMDGIRVATSWAGLFSTTGIFNTTADILQVKLIGKTLTVTNSPSSSVEIFNALGAKVKTLELVNGSVELSLTKGIYIVRAGQKTAKIMM